MNFFINFKNVIPFLLPFAIPFSRSIADITIILIALAFLCKSYFENDWHWAGETWFKMACVFVVYCVFVNSSLSINPTESLKYSIYFLRWPLFALALTYWVFTDLQSLKNFLYIIIFVTLFLILDTWYQYVMGHDIFGIEKFSITRLTGPFRRPYIGMWITKLIILPLLCFAIIKTYKDFLRKKYLFITLFIFLGVYFLTIFITGERMALLMTLLSIFIILLGLIADKHISILKILFLFILISLSTYFFSITNPEQSQRVIFSSIDKIINWKTSDYGLVWKSAYDVWQESPLFGAGLHKYREACGLLGIYGNADNPISAGVCFHPHNISMQLLSETGIVGFVLFFSMVIALSIEMLKEYFLNKNWLIFSLSLNILLACFLPIQSNTDFFSNKYSSLVWLLIGVSLAVSRYIKNKKN